jgi:signal transduction histidine kinase
MKIRPRSLQAKYMLIILVALVLVQAGYVLIALLALKLDNRFDGRPVLDERDVEREWHEAAQALAPPYGESAERLFARWGERFPEASMFRIDEYGRLAEQWRVRSPLPERWTAAQTADFIKKRYGGDPFTVIAFTGGETANGFVVMELPRERFDPPLIRVMDEMIVLIGIAVLIGLFILISYLFFRGIRRRLLVLSQAMAVRDADGLPVAIDVHKPDEIGQLELSFNNMVAELRESRRREREEEEIRRELIAHLSHDLRTPLTKIRANAYSVGKEEMLSPQGHRAVQAIESSVDRLDRLIDNLMSHTLLTAGKLPYRPEPTDVVRFVKEQLAAWYPIFEKEGMEVEAEMEPFAEKMWTVDPAWFGRILDNLFQNVLRHAKDGRYIGLFTESDDGHDAIVIRDRGGGRDGKTGKKGAGLGLSIVDRMVRGMGLAWRLEPGDTGTVVRIIRPKT